MTDDLQIDRDEIIDSLYQRLQPQFPAEHHQALNTFIFEFLKHASLRDLENYKTSDLAGMAVAMWRALQTRNANHKGVQVLNPNIEEHDWQNQHTIVSVVTEDKPFVIDSMRLALSRHAMNIHALFYGNFHVKRDKEGQFVSFDKKGAAELLLCIEVDRTTDEAQKLDVQNELQQVLVDVDYVVDDFSAMRDKTLDVVKDLDSDSIPISSEDKQEAKVLMQWLTQNHFSFLAYDEYVIDDGQVKQVKGSALGLFRKNKKRRVERVTEMTPARQEHVFKKELLIFTKSGHRSTVHRSAYSDYILVKQFNDKGEVVGGRRFMGLFTSNVYSETPASIPVVRKKLEQVLKNSGYSEGSHAYKELVAILYNFPRDELIQSSIDWLLKVGNDVLSIQERKQIRLFMRTDAYGKFLNIVIYMPRDIFNTQIRIQMHDLFADYFDVAGSDYTTFFSESVLARTRFVFKLTKPIDALPATDFFESRIVQMSRSWNDELQTAMIEAFGEEQGIQLYQSYEYAFPPSYIEEYSARVAVADVQRIQTLHSNEDSNISLNFFQSIEPNGSVLKLKIFNRGEALILSDLIPVLENLGLKVIDEYPYEIEHPTLGCTWIYDFNLRYEPQPDIDPARHRERFSDAFLNIWRGHAENDAFNQLVLRANLTWQQVAMFRAYAKYLKQIQFSLSTEYISQTLIDYTDITCHLASLFAARFNPESKDNQSADNWQKVIVDKLDDVNNINEDRIFRRYIELMMATLRTNFYQKDSNGSCKSYISYKLDPQQISELPLPKPKYEIFVYSPRVEGVHLRGGSVSRGGLRWSDRNEDFRTEVLGLVKAQQVKNAVIVPVGAKGGFVAKQLPAPDNREAFMAEGIECYKTFIRGLLDITDNLVEKEIVPPQGVLRHDGDDPYLVVAADKGTATFSDIANSVAEDYGFWLGDAFASGGSNGYDHKKMGITARGAWVSVQRHFREIGIDVQKDPITVVGIGDMAGDVFGNGLLRSESVKLIGAFNHLHIFFDPDPDPKASFKERQRLFDLPRSSWTDYDESLISKGGGIFSRASKSIAVTEQMKSLLGIKQARVTPTELITALLKAKVDLLWNGGIGTYVKASNEQHSDIGDKANDAVRINGKELRCKVVGEGGNLGLSQLGRIEYNLAGGACFTDFIDNAGGVDCSDHEVNIKVLLDDMVMHGDLTVKQRNETLESLTEDVSKLVLDNNYRQTQALGLAFSQSNTNLEEYRRLMNALENAGKLDRSLEFMPTNEQLSERKADGLGLTRPELAVLISYVKGDLKELLATEELANDPVISNAIETEFPQALVSQLGDHIDKHLLKKEIIATITANEMVNYLGINSYNRLQESTGASAVEIAKAFVASREIFGLTDIWQQIEALDYKVPAELQNNMMLKTSRMVRRATRWILRNYRTGIDIQEVVGQFKERLSCLEKELEGLLPDHAKETWLAKRDNYIEQGAPKALATKVASVNILYSSLGIIAVSQNLDMKVERAADAYFRIGEALGLELFTTALNAININSHWQAMAREAYRDDIEWQQRRIVQGLLANDSDPSQAVDEKIGAWMGANHLLVERWLRMINEVRSISEPEFSMYSVAIRELLGLSQVAALD
ncbi:NAD-glutamate dehydrogenase [Reinekea thalattae]|uniref:NAD-glutamate dehydrogenase n=1 Tax=Reinekea thalattae TaxID=2593301 RepID=A0A5C8Z8H2_9GAMM|nr:NAD-glutamate dehydrogenase [Reinekea thalattae]TXR53558.1 NAD-glutamate dehydrogenase [Reinekea thalattae]